MAVTLPKPTPSATPAPPIPFGPGDLVQLKTGGPTMIVEVGTYKNAKARWFTEDGLLHEAVLSVQILKSVEA